MHPYLNTSKSMVFNYKDDCSSDDLSICRCSSFSLYHGDFEPDCTSKTSWKEKQKLTISDSDFYSVVDFNPDKQDTGAFMTGDMFSFKKNLEPRFARTHLSFTCEKENSACDTSETDLRDDRDVLYLKQELKSPMNLERFYCKGHSVNLNEVPSLHYDQLHECENNNQESLENEDEKYQSLVKLQSNIKKMKKRTMEYSPKYQPGTLTWVKPFKTVNKTKPRIKNKELTKKTEPSKTNLKITSDQKFQMNCKNNKAHTVQKKRKVICVGTQYSDVFSNEIVSAQKILNETDPTKVTRIDINLKNSEQIVAVADLIIEALNQNLKFSTYDERKIKRVPKGIKKSWLTQDVILRPGMIKQFCFPLKKKFKNNVIIKEKSVHPSKSVQFCLDRFASAFEKELSIRLGKAKEKTNTSYCAERSNDKNLHGSEDMFRKFEKEFDEEISKIKEKV